MKILLATNNQAKVARLKRLLALLEIECLTPQELGIEVQEIVEGSDLQENARMKALAYHGKTDLPILSNDGAFGIAGVDLDPATVKRNALNGRDEFEMTQDEIADAMLAFYINLAKEVGGRRSAWWNDVFALVMPDGTAHTDISSRAVFLTDVVSGPVDPYFPIRSLYINVLTNKRPHEQAPEEEVVALGPMIETLKRLMEKADRV